MIRASFYPVADATNEKRKTMANIEEYGLACVDCIIAIANDDYSALTDARAAEVRAAISNVGGWLIAGDETSTDFFSCDVCGSRGFGDAHIVLIDRA